MENKIKPRRCKTCQIVFTPLRQLQGVCGYDCAKVHADKLKANKAKQERKILKEKLKTLSEYEADAKKSFQRFIRFRDKDLPCISCGNENPTDWAGGHFYSAGMYSGFIFDERNCHKQCNTYCNKHLSGNLLEYRKGLIKRYGNDFVNELDNISDSKRDYKYTKAELIAKKLQYNIKYNEIK